MTPTLSVEAVQETESEVWVEFVLTRAVGALGAVISLGFVTARPHVWWLPPAAVTAQFESAVTPVCPVRNA